MSFHRILVVAVATFISIGMTSIASASCCGWGYSAPVAYATVAPAVYGGCGTCGTPTAAAVFAAPVAPAPIVVTAVAPTAFGGPCCGWNGCGNCGWGGWGGGCGNCGWGGWGGCGNCGGCGSCGVAYAAPSLYVVNQGPYYSGPGIMTPYPTYAPEAAYAPATDYPYVPGSGYGYGYGATVPPYAPYYRHAYYRPRYGYRMPYAHPYMRARYYGGRGWRRYP